MEGQRVEDRGFISTCLLAYTSFKNQLNNKKLNIHTNLWSICSAIFCLSLIKSKRVRRNVQDSVLSSWNSFGGKEQTRPLGSTTVSFWKAKVEAVALISSSPVPSIGPGSMVTGDQQTFAEWMDSILSKGIVLCFCLLWWNLRRSPGGF